MVFALAVQTAFSIRAAALSCTEELAAAFEYTAAGRGADCVTDGLKFGEADWTAVCSIRLYGGGEEYAGNVLAASEELMGSDGFVKPTELQRAAITLSAAGECPRRLINAAAYNNENLSKQGFNAWIWALIAANCSGMEAEENALYTRSELAEEIVSRQLSDGGFNLKGEGADADMTAAAIYALAPLRGESETDAALERALERLSELQQPSGGFASMGNENCESTAQAIIAFASLGLDEGDSRVSRALSAMLEYQNDDGGFAHLSGGKSNGLATAQAIEAMTALRLLEQGELLFGEGFSENGGSAQNAPENVGEPEQTAPENGGKSEQTAPESDELEQTVSENPASLPTGVSAADTPTPSVKKPLSGKQIKLLICAAAGAGCAAFLAAGLLRRSKRCLALAALCAAAAGGVWLLDIKSAEEYYSQEAKADFYVSFSVTCHAAAENLSTIDESVNPLSVIPEDGVVIAQRRLGLPEGATAFEALLEAARQEQIRVDYTGTVYGAYVSGIGYIYEFGFGDMSGWLYRVNGEFPEVSAGAYALSEGDTVEFIYTCDGGGDL